MLNRKAQYNSILTSNSITCPKIYFPKFIAVELWICGNGVFDMDIADDADPIFNRSTLPMFIVNMRLVSRFIKKNALQAQCS